MHNKRCGERHHPEVRDFGPESFVFNVEHVTKMNQNFRTVLWTGEHLQLTLMSMACGYRVPNT